MKRIASAPEIYAQGDQQMQPGNSICGGGVDHFNVRKTLPFADATQSKNKRARRVRLDWTDGLHTRFVLSIIEGNDLSIC
jgi:hypothetical protein